MWIPLESNPETFNSLLQAVGVTNKKATFVDVYGVSTEMLSFIPRPVYAFVFVYPITQITNTFTTEHGALQQQEVQEFTNTHKFFFTKQTIGNACGMIAFLHAVLNNTDNIGEIDKNSLLEHVQQVMKGVTPKQAAKIIEENLNLALIHGQAALSDINATQNVNMNTNLHFVCFIHVADRCIELDGRQSAPILHGKCDNNEEFVDAAASAIRERMNMLPDCFDFNIMALVSTDSVDTNEETFPQKKASFVFPYFDKN